MTFSMGDKRDQAHSFARSVMIFTIAVLNSWLCTRQLLPKWQGPTSTYKPRSERSLSHKARSEGPRAKGDSRIDRMRAIKSEDAGASRNPETDLTEKPLVADLKSYCLCNFRLNGSV